MIDSIPLDNLENGASAQIRDLRGRPEQVHRLEERGFRFRCLSAGKRRFIRSGQDETDTHGEDETGGKQYRPQPGVSGTQGHGFMFLRTDGGRYTARESG